MSFILYILPLENHLKSLSTVGCWCLVVYKRDLGRYNSRLFLELLGLVFPGGGEGGVGGGGINHPLFPIHPLYLPTSYLVHPTTLWNSLFFYIQSLWS